MHRVSIKVPAKFKSVKCNIT